MRILIATAVGLTFATQAFAMDIVTGANEVKWAPAPASIMPPGAQIAIMSGDPTKPGPFVMRLKFPANYQIPAHKHPTDEQVTVLSGKVGVGMGDKMNKAAGTTMTTGGFASLPGNMNHYVWSVSPSIVQVAATGPFTTIYANPADAPGAQKK